MIVDKEKIAHSIQKKLNHSVDKNKIKEVINLVSEHIEEEICKGNSFSVDKFGTFGFIKNESRDSINISTGNVETTKESLTVRFRPHFVFTELLKKRLKKFSKKNNNS